ncbi:MAG: cache domain-containing protein, partial [Polyangia bacterium]|nr:cache domain-containing protein [Polyangia bacterium]
MPKQPMKPDDRATHKVGIFRLLRRWLQRRTMRTKLLTAFFSLIITSATATVVIALMVFGRQISGLAASEMEVGLNVAEHSLRLQTKRTLDLVAQEAKRPGSLRSDPAHSSPCGFRREFTDFLLEIGPKGTVALHFIEDRKQGSDDPGALAAVNCRRKEVPEGAIDGSSLGELLSHVRKTRAATAGFYMLPLATKRALGIAGEGAEGLFLAAAASRPDGGIVLLGSSLHNRRDILDEALRVLRTKHRRWYEASIFLRGIRVVTTLKGGSIGTRVDETVLGEVLGRGRRYVGSAKVIDEPFYTAYMPLVDHRGVP